MKKYKYILFDWDGTLAQTLHIWLNAYKETFAEYNLYPDEKDIVKKVFGDWNGPIKLGVKDILDYNRKLLVRINENYPTVKLYDNVESTIQKLRSEGKKIALVTTGASAVVQPALESNHLEDDFNVVLTADNVLKYKPDPEIVYKAIEMLNGEKGESIIIGDSKSDLGAALNAGIDSVLFFPKENDLFYDINELMEYKPTFVIKEFKELLEILN